MLNINIELTRLTQEEAERGKVAAAYFMPYEQETESDRLARDLLAPLAVAELMRKAGNEYQKNHAHKLGEMFAECSAVCGSALWFCGSSEEAEALTLAKSYRVRAYLVRANW